MSTKTRLSVFKEKISAPTTAGYSERARKPLGEVQLTEKNLNLPLSTTKSIKVVTVNTPQPSVRRAAQTELRSQRTTSTLGKPRIKVAPQTPSLLPSTVSTRKLRSTLNHEDPLLADPKALPIPEPRIASTISKTTRSSEGAEPSTEEHILSSVPSRIKENQGAGELSQKLPTLIVSSAESHSHSHTLSQHAATHDAPQPPGHDDSEEAASPPDALNGSSSLNNSDESPGGLDSFSSPSSALQGALPASASLQVPPSASQTPAGMMQWRMRRQKMPRRLPGLRAPSRASNFQEPSESPNRPRPAPSPAASPNRPSASAAAEQHHQQHHHHRAPLCQEPPAPACPTSAALHAATPPVSPLASAAATPPVASSSTESSPGTEVLGPSPQAASPQQPALPSRSTPLKADHPEPSAFQLPVSSLPTPVSSLPTPSSSLPTPISSLPTPIASLPTPVSSLPTLISNGSMQTTETESQPQPASALRGHDFSSIGFLRVAEQESTGYPVKSVIEMAAEGSEKKEVYYVLKRIGSGGSCKVYQVMNKNGDFFGLKRVKRDEHSESVYAREISILQRPSLKEHSLIINLRAVGLSRKFIYLLLELGSADFKQILQRSKSELVTRLRLAKESQQFEVRDYFNQVRVYWQQILKAVQAAHDAGVIHCDLKPANFLNVDGVLKLIDFGISKELVDEGTHVLCDATKIQGSLYYIPPEAFTVEAGGVKFRTASDVWSLGCILYQMTYGVTPFHSLPMMEVVNRLRQKTPIDFPRVHSQIPCMHIPSSLIRVLQLCLRYNPSERPTIQDLIRASLDF